MDRRAIDERFANLALHIKQANFLLEVIEEIPAASADPQCAHRRRAFFDLLFDVLGRADGDVEALSPAVCTLLFGAADSPEGRIPRG